MYYAIIIVNYCFPKVVSHSIHILNHAVVTQDLLLDSTLSLYSNELLKCIPRIILNICAENTNLCGCTCKILDDRSLAFDITPYLALITQLWGQMKFINI